MKNFVLINSIILHKKRSMVSVRLWIWYMSVIQSAWKMVAGLVESEEGEKVDAWPLANTDRRQEGEEVILLIVNHIPGVLLLPFFWVAKPHSSGTVVTHSTAPWPRAAPERGTQSFKINSFNTNRHWLHKDAIGTGNSGKHKISGLSHKCVKIHLALTS